ncbi:MAG: hypothetical protein IJM36_04460 [Acholeplasmatales bacterium]|nr:hypothetical protein [Acholeplasmatales bacterium]
MNKKLILNLISLIVTSMLLVMVVFSWYISNDSVKAEGIFGKTEDEDYTLKLQRGTYNSANSTWTWTDTTSLSISNIQPGDSFFFRIIITTSKNINLNMDFSGIESDIDSSIAVENGYVTIGSTKRYNIVNNKVQITEGGSAKTLYNISGSTVSLADYKVEDTFRFYSYGICTTNPNSVVSGTSGVTVTYAGSPLDNDVSNDGITPVVLGSVATNYTVTAAGTDTIAFAYFALEFNDEASIVDYSYTFDGSTKTCSDSNLYQSQYLNIKRINVIQA